ncbi:MAG: hypothetical protein H6Q67_1672 [Firmicutes bacterium]|nr:hypothetical protein [Bacillota bacterium]
MLAEIQVLFSYPVSPFGHLIDAVEGAGADPSHSAIFMLGGILEALDNGFVKSPLNAYEGRKTTVITVKVPDMEAAEVEAGKLLGTPYGYIDCVNGGLHDLTGANIPGDGELTVDCSEAVTRILRAGGLDILPGLYADCVTPADLLEALTALVEAA